jgi:hypothetical protein
MAYIYNLYYIYKSILIYFNKYENIIYIEMNQQYNSIKKLIIYNVLHNMLRIKKYVDQYLSPYYTS